MKWWKKPTTMTLIYWIKKVFHIVMTSICVQQRSFLSGHKNFSNILCLKRNNEKTKIGKSTNNIKNDIDFIIDFLIFIPMNWMFWIFSNEFYLELYFKLLSIHNDLAFLGTYEVPQLSLNLKFRLTSGKSHKASILLQDAKRKKWWLHHIFFHQVPR